MVHDTPPSQDASTHLIWNSYLKEYRRYAPDTKRDGRTDIVMTIKTKSEVKIKVTQKWYATLRHPKMHPHTKFGILTSKNIGDMHRTRSGMDGRTVRLLYASQSSFGGITTASMLKLTVYNYWRDTNNYQHEKNTPALYDNLLFRAVYSYSKHIYCESVT